MSRTPITPIIPVGPYPVLPVAANSLDFTWTAADPVNLNAVTFGATNRLLVLVNNTSPSAQTFTISSVRDQFNRTGDITNYSLGSGEFAVFEVQRPGWFQSDGNLYLSANSNTVRFAVFTL
jgi:hypothetical protein